MATMMWSCNVLILLLATVRIEGFSVELGKTRRAVAPETTFAPILPPDDLIVASTGRMLDKLPLDEEQPSLSTQQCNTAIVLNINARQVSSDLEPLAKSIFGEQHVFVTTSEEEARKVAGSLLDYSLVIPVGGDGTLASLINMMAQASSDTTKTTLEHLPLIGYVPMGTGNGLGSVVGASQPKGGGLFRRKRRKLQQLKETFIKLKAVGDNIEKKDKCYEVIEIPMIQVSTPNKNKDADSLCFFAGVGFDSLLLNDFKEQKAWSERTGFLREVLGSVAGYCVALVTRTLPRGKHTIHVDVRTPTPEHTLWVDHRRGDTVVPCEDSLLYKGSTGILAAGTSPFYGGGMRMFPFARMHADKMHLRLGRIQPATGVMNLKSIFAGSFRDGSDRFGVIDFIGKDFNVEVRSQEENDKDGFPMQHSGESVGNVESFRLQVVEEPVRFVSFWEPRVLVDE